MITEIKGKNRFLKMINRFVDLIDIMKKNRFFKLINRFVDLIKFEKLIQKINFF